jgi:hypothetical protein
MTTPTRGDPRLDTMEYLWLEEGASYQEIGDAFGLSRERIRQILSDGGVLTAENRRRAQQARVRKRDEFANMKTELVLTRWRQMVKRADIARETGIGRDRVVKIINENTTAAERERHLHAQQSILLTKALKSSAKSDEAVIGDLAWAAARLKQSRLSVPAYEELRRLFPERRMVTVAVIIKRFGSWNNAVTEAGLIPNPLHHRSNGAGDTPEGWQKRTFEEHDYRQALWDCFTEIGNKIPSIQDYEDWRRRVHDTGMRGVPGSVPSVSSFRWRYGSWMTALQKAGLL